MSIIRRVHRRQYRPREDLRARLDVLQEVIANLRDCNLSPDSKKRMLNHAIWEITRATGDFAPQFRSKGVMEGSLGAKIEREHVYKRKGIVQAVLAKSEPLDSVLKCVVHCVVTEEEHERLKTVPAAVDGWARYCSAGIEVFDCAVDPPTPRLCPADRAGPFVNS